MNVEEPQAVAGTSIQSTFAYAFVIWLNMAMIIFRLGHLSLSTKGFFLCDRNVTSKNILYGILTAYFFIPQL